MSRHNDGVLGSGRVTVDGGFDIGLIVVMMDSCTQAGNSASPHTYVITC